MKTIQQHRDEIVRFGKLLHQTGLVAATDGNLSVRLDDGNFLCTPTLMSKGMMEPDDLVIVDQHGQKAQRPARSFQRNRDAPVHLPQSAGCERGGACASSDGNRICGGGNSAGQRAVLGDRVTLGSVPLASYETPGTAELAEALAPLVGDHDAILMANHGVVTYGEDLLTAYMNMETVEHYAKIALVTHMLGRQQPLSDTASSTSCARSA